MTMIIKRSIQFSLVRIVYSQHKLTLFSYSLPLLMQEPCTGADKLNMSSINFNGFPLDMGQPCVMEDTQKRVTGKNKIHVVLIIGNFVTYSNWQTYFASPLALLIPRFHCICAWAKTTWHEYICGLFLKDVEKSNVCDSTNVASAEVFHVKRLYRNDLQLNN